MVENEMNGLGDEASLVPEKARGDYDKWLSKLHKNHPQTVRANERDLALLQELAFGPDDSAGFLEKHLGNAVKPNTDFALNSSEPSEEYRKYRTNYQRLLGSVETAADMLTSCKLPGKKANQAFTKALLRKWVELEQEHGLYPPISLAAQSSNRGELAERCAGLQKIKEAHTPDVQHRDFSDSSLDEMRRYVSAAQDDLLRSAEGRILASAILMLNQEIIAAQTSIVKERLRDIEYEHIYGNAYDYARGLLFKYDPAVTSEKSTDDDKSIKFNSYLTNGLRNFVSLQILRPNRQEKFWKEAVSVLYVSDDKGQWKNVVDSAPDPRSVDENDPDSGIPISSQGLLDIIETDRLFDAREQKILKMRNGLGEYDKKYTLKAIGKELGVCKERIRQIEAVALEKLRDRVLEVANEPNEQESSGGFSERVVSARGNGSRCIS